MAYLIMGAAPHEMVGLEIMSDYNRGVELPKYHSNTETVHFAVMATLII